MTEQNNWKQFSDDISNMSKKLNLILRMKKMLMI